MSIRPNSSAGRRQPAFKATLTSKNTPNWRPGRNCMTDQNNVDLFYKMKSFGCTFLLCALRFSSWVFEEKKSKALGQEAKVPIYCIECIYINTLLYKIP